MVGNEEVVRVTVRRWATTTLVMALVGAGLLALLPDPDLVEQAITAPQTLVDTRGVDALLVVLAWALTAAGWTWGALGLALTGLSTLPGWVGRVATGAVLVLLPAGARRAAAVAVGLSLVAAPAGTTAFTAGPSAATVVAVGAASDAWAPDVPGGQVSPDWPVGNRQGTASPAPGPSLPTVPDWPTAATADEHVVVRGDCLWHVAERWLAQQTPGIPPGPAAVALAVDAWWRANAGVIGADPDLLLPGQVLVPPPA